MPEEQRIFIGRKLDKAWRRADPDKAEKQFRRVNGYRDLQLLRIALEATRPATAKAAAPVA